MNFHFSAVAATRPNAAHFAGKSADGESRPSRRYEVLKITLLSALLFAAFTSQAATSKNLSQPAETNTVTTLRCDLLAHPDQTVITAKNPRFGWVYKPFFRGDHETGYRIIVASSRALAAAGKGDLWDSGWVQSSNSINVLYAGSALHPNTSYCWRIAPIDSKGQHGAFSAIQRFKTGNTLSDPLQTRGVFYHPPRAGSANCYPLRYVPAMPVRLTNTAPGDWFIDFGQDAFGYVTLRTLGRHGGTNVEVRFGEKASGHAVDTHPGADIRYGQTLITLRNGKATYAVHPPAHRGHAINPPARYGVVMPFRYVELRNFPGSLSITDVVQQRLVSEFDPHVATFTSSSRNLNQVWKLCHDSMEWLTFDGIYVDGDRERRPYEADCFIQQMTSYSMDNQFTLPRCTFEYLTHHPTWPTEWKFHMVFIAWADYLQTGNTYLLNKYYPVLTNDCLLNRAGPDGLIKGIRQGGSSGDIIDWPASDRDGFVWNYTNTVINAFYYRCMRIMTQVAQITGHPADATDFAARANQVFKSYQKAFWDADKHCYIDSEGTKHASIHANFFPLAFGLVPTNKVSAVVHYLNSRLASGGMIPSVYGAQYLLEGLFKAGDADTALGLMLTNSPRSWMSMINAGSTLTTEAWNTKDKPNEDWNHAWGSAAGNLISRYVLGLRPLVAGYGRVLIQPQLGHTLTYAQGKVPTIRGPIFISATKQAGQFLLRLTLPGNVTARVMLPASGSSDTQALVDGKIVSGKLANGWLTLTNIGAGKHVIVTGKAY